MSSALVYLYFCSFMATTVQAVARPRGVPIEKASFYADGAEFHCLSDNKAMPMDHVNDDYCDCKDGSDEPGTSACSNGLFYCENKAYKGVDIISSRVNDGVCDCCDGSDEYDGTITCENTCEKLYASVKAEQEALLRTQEQGYRVKQEYMQQGKRAKDEKVSRLSQLERDKEAFVNDKNRLEALKEEAEKPEKEAIDKHNEAWEAVKAERQKTREAEKAAIAFANLDVNKDNKVDFPEIQQHLEFDIDSDGTVSEEEAKEYLEENEEVSLEQFTEKIWPNIKEIYKSPETEEHKEEKPEEEVDPLSSKQVNVPPDGPDGIIEGGSDEDLSHDDHFDDDADDEDDDDDDFDDDFDVDEEEEYDISRIQKDDKNQGKLSEDASEDDKMPEYDEETKKLISIADEARNQFKEADKKVQDIEREISGIKTYLELDFGPNEEFAALKDQCFEFTDREYTYKLCPFDKSSQKPKGGGIETSLGTWGHWYGPEEDKYDAMKYENGQGCWNGPSRTCHVNLHCGVENALIGASEPSRCEYQFEFTTPARCNAPPAHGVLFPHEEL